MVMSMGVVLMSWQIKKQKKVLSEDFTNSLLKMMLTAVTGIFTVLICDAVNGKHGPYFTLK